MRIWKHRAFWRITAAVVLAGAFLMGGTSRLLPALAPAGDEPVPVCLVLDAGHGGEDGGAVSVTGENESTINLAITLRLNDFLRALGRNTKLLRSGDVSLHDPSCTSISEKKVSDLRNRVRMVNETPGAVLVSIHQNMFSEAKYHGAQVFYAPTDGSEELAEIMQTALSACIDPQNHRQCKPAQSVYLLSRITCPAVLVECGFLSNPAEEALLRDETYQKKLAVVIGCTVSQYTQGNEG